MKSVIFKILFPFIFFLMISLNANAQYELSSKIFSNVGFEHNPYLSPDTFYDYKNHIGYSKAELLKPDNFIEYGYNISAKKIIKSKFFFNLTSEWQNKKYFTETILNTGLFNIGLAPSVVIKKWLTLGTGYEFEKRSMVDADILGEQTKYVLAYIQNTGQFFIKTKPFKGNITNLYYTLNQQKYSNTYTSYNVNDSTLIDLNLDNVQNTLDLRMIQTLTKKSSVTLKMILYDKKYKYLPSYDSLLTPDSSSMRHYNNFNIKLTYDNKLNNFIELKPYVKYERQKDMFNNYYSYNKCEGGLMINLTYRKFELELNGWYRKYNYDKYEAPILTTPYPPLVYQYFNGKATLTYKILNGLNAVLTIYAVNLKSNANRPTWRYRRGYENNYVKLGIILYPDKLFKLNEKLKIQENKNDENNESNSTEREKKPEKD